jgi:hypothetical protein
MATMATMYNTTIALILSPVWHNNPPLVEVCIDDTVQQVELTETKTFNYQILSHPKDLVVSVTLLNKKDSDTIPERNLDKAVIVDSLTVNGITDSRFVWAGEYRPDYPEPWFSQQQTVPPAVLKNHNYLSWNGSWLINIQVPAFLWMHRVLGLGWVYD